jgi:hypothetical protein
MKDDLTQELGLISEAAYAKLRDKAIGSVRNERARGDGPAYVKLGRQVLYPLAAVKAYIAANTVSPSKQPTLVTGTITRGRRHK